MSKLKEAIQQLMLKQQEVELYSALIEYVPGWANTDKAYEAVADKVSKEVQEFCQKKIRLIEGSEAPKPIKVVQPEVTTTLDRTEEPLAEDEVPKDPLKFVVKYKDWHNKAVLVKDGYGNRVEAKLIGALYPNLRIELIDGSIIPAHPRDVELKPE